ncbi:Hypothetical_protein [Hexamita inflata]|uniref:Hypothetical_protein n=1 Tax=Hexamita inflata TaxID=28002 RepID=A0AA86RFZ4_9EUKA|nr:Hypothetical protein HINF_LOCUS61633 [Hexamita inflata]
MQHGNVVLKNTVPVISMNLLVTCVGFRAAAANSTPAELPCRDAELLAEDVLVRVVVVTGVVCLLGKYSSGLSPFQSPVFSKSSHSLMIQSHKVPASLLSSNEVFLRRGESCLSDLGEYSFFWVSLETSVPERTRELEEPVLV